MKKSEDSDAFPKWNTNIKLQSQSKYAHGNKPIIYFNNPCKAIEIYICAKKNCPFTNYPAAKHPKHSKFAITDMLEKPADFFLVQHGRRL